MSKIAEVMNGYIAGINFFTFKVGYKYKDAKKALVFNNTKVKTPHYIDSYIILT